MSGDNALERELAAFRAAHAVRRLTHGGREWRYYAAGNGDDTVLLLGGALGLAEFSFQTIGLLSPHARVVAPDYPPVSSLDEMIDGLAALADAEGIPRAHVVGGSFGGIVAQALVRRAPARVASLVLSHTGVPDGRRRRAGIAIFGMLPTALLRLALKARLGRTLDAADPFWRRWFEQAVDSLTKADIMSRIRLQAEFGAAHYAAGDLDTWSGRILLIESADDPFFTAEARQRLHAIYPSAAVHEFKGTGHVAAILQPEAYVSVMTRFFASARI